MRWLAVDPGMANTGVLLMDGMAIVSAFTFTTKGDGPVPTFAEALGRCEAQALQVVALARTHRAALIVCESYQDFGGGHKRGSKHRWTTPLMLMALHVRAQDTAPIVWQSPATVLTCYREHKAAWKAGVRGIIPGDECITNDHLRSAGVHALAYLDREGEPR